MFGGSSGGGGGLTDKNLKLAQLGMKMLAPPPSPFAPGGGPAQPNAQVQQVQRRFGVDYQTALQLMQMMRSNQGQAQAQPLPQMAFGGRPVGPTIVGERGPEIFVPDVPGSIVLIPRRDTGYDAILRAMELGARIQRRRFGMPEELY